MRPISRPVVLAAVLGLVVGGISVAVATPTDVCTDAYLAPMDSTAKLQTYIDCREDRQDAALERIEAQFATSAPATPGPTPTASGSPPPSVEPAPRTTPSPTTASSGLTSARPAGAVCQPGKEVVKFDGPGSAGLDQYGFPNYDASAELWGVTGYNYTQTMGVCSNDSWYVNITTDNTKGDGAVKAYPSMRRIYHDWGKGGDFSGDPLLSSFPRLEVDFAAIEPGSCSDCIYNTAFDVWLNGIGNGTSNELMIWTHNVGQRPFGSKVASGIKIGGRTWDLWSGNDNHYIAYVPSSNLQSGTLDVKDFTADLVSRGLLKTDSRLGQISYGVEAVSTNAVVKHWDFTKFSIRDD